MPGVSANIPNGRQLVTGEPIIETVTTSTVNINPLDPGEHSVLDLYYWLTATGKVGAQRIKYVEYHEAENKLWQTIPINGTTEAPVQIHGTIFAKVHASDTEQITEYIPINF